MANDLQTHSFDKVKNELRDFAEKIPETIEFTSVPSEGGLFGLFPHLVTGTEVNGLTAKLEDYIIKSGQFDASVLKEFGIIYDAFEALDKDYIAGIKTSVEAARKANKKAEDALSGIKKSVEEDKKVLAVLKNFKARLDKLKHLENVDDIWNELNVNKDNINLLDDKITNIIEIIDRNIVDIEGANSQIESMKTVLEELLEFYSEIKTIEHIKEIDNIYENCDLNSKDIIELKEAKISVEGQIRELDSDVSVLTDENQKLKDKVVAIEELYREEKDKVIFLTKKERITRVVACAATLCSVACLILNLLGIV